MVVPPRLMTRPSSGSTRPASSARSDDLPSPLPPTMPMRSPSSIPSETESKTVFAGYSRWTFSHPSRYATERTSFLTQPEGTNDTISSHEHTGYLPRHFGGWDPRGVCAFSGDLTGLTTRRPHGGLTSQVVFKRSRAGGRSAVAEVVVRWRSAEGSMRECGLEDIALSRDAALEVGGRRGWGRGHVRNTCGGVQTASAAGRGLSAQPASVEA